mgnify:CR=1 FL=1
MEVKLTDFTSKQLDTMLSAAATLQVDLQNKIEIQHQYDIDMDLGYTEQLDNISLWVVQLIAAKVEVRSREVLYSN